MNRDTIYIRTDKGERTVVSASGGLAGDLRKLLEAIDGNSSVDALQNRIDFLSLAGLYEALATLVADDLIRDAENVQTERKAQELRAKIKARREGTDRSLQDGELRDLEAEEQARREAVESVRQETEEQARRLAEEKALREAAERARQEAEAQAKRMAAELARRDAEEKTRREAEAQARMLAEEQSRREAAERAQQDAEAEAQKIAAELARRDEERARQEAEERARVEADEKAWREAEDKFRREELEAAAESRKRAAAKGAKATASTRPRNLGLVIALGLVAALVIGLAVVHLISFDGQIPQFEKAATVQFQQPVKIKALRLSLLPHVQLRLEDVTIGAEGQIKVPQIRATGDLGNLFSEKKSFKSIEIDSPVITEAGLAWLLFGKPVGGGVAVVQVGVSNARLESGNISLPAFGGKIQLEGDGSWKAIVIESADKNLSLDLAPKGESLQFDFKARSFKLPFGSDLTLDDMIASGTASNTELAVNEFKGFAYGGTLGGNARLKWGTAWSLAGDLSVKQVDMERLVPGLMSGGRLAGDAAYVMQATEAAKLFAANRLEGSFLVARGSLLGVDLGRMMQGGGMAGETRFAEITGGFVHDRGATQLRQLRLTEGAVSANGSAEVDADSTVRGRFAIELRMSTEQRRANLALAGTLKKIEWRRP